MAEQGDQSEVGDQLRESAALAQAIGTRIWRPYQLSLLAEVHDKLGQREEPEHMLVEAYEVAKKSGERFWEAELHRLKGETLLSHPVKDLALSEACFDQALNIAQRQQAKSLELRAATSLSRQWRQEGKHGEARDLLAPIYGWFTEGFDTADLREAAALLKSLD